MELEIRTPRLRIVPFELGYLDEYHSGFNGEIARYQYPDPFGSKEAAKEGLQGFIDLMERGEMLFLSILTPDGGFAGGAEVHGLQEQYPELGVWIRTQHQRKGYAYEALANIMRFTADNYHKEWFVYEADVRNESSMKLVEKFPYKKEGIDEFETETGKSLILQRFLIKNGK